MIKWEKYSKFKKDNYPRKIGNYPQLTYSNVPKDEEGWVDALKYLPKDYDLCLFQTKEKGTRTGWLNKRSWDGLTMDFDDEVLLWKRKKEDIEKSF
jgi:hypothetical protein